MDDVHLRFIDALRTFYEIVEARVDANAAAISKNDAMMAKSRETIARTRERLAIAQSSGVFDMNFRR